MRALPPPWKVALRKSRSAADSAGADAILTVEPPVGDPIRFMVETARPSASMTAVVAQVRDLQRYEQRPILLVTRFANPTLRVALERLGLSYVDATGWIYLRDDTRGLFVRSEGAARGPRDRARNDITRLSGAATSRVIEELVLVERPIGVRDLAELADVSPGTVSKVLPTLVSAGTIERDAGGVVTLVRKRTLVERWSRDYRFDRTNHNVQYFLFPRGVDRLLKQLDGSVGFATTGIVAASTYLAGGTIPVVPTLRVSLYAADPDSLAHDLNLADADAPSANCVIARPSDLSVLGRATRPHGQLPAVTLPRVLADLMTTPGRDSLVAEQLMDQLSETDPGWIES